VLGEIGLGGELRQASQCTRRLTEAARLGFARAVVPRLSPPEPPGIAVVRVATLGEALEAVGIA
jgi:DNA repair protein RadA/Sms